jgi:hypothetical protein
MKATLLILFVLTVMAAGCVTRYVYVREPGPVACARGYSCSGGSVCGGEDTQCPPGQCCYVTSDGVRVVNVDVQIPPGM